MDQKQYSERNNEGSSNIEEVAGKKTTIVWLSEEKRRFISGYNGDGNGATG